MSDVFISYASEDRARAKLLAEVLEASGFSVWWDRKIVVGQAYDEVIEHELETARSVVVLWSKYSVVSEWVKNEAQVAVERGTLVPALIDAVKPPLEFRRKQTADLIGWDGDLGHAGFDTLRRGVSVHLARELPTQPPSAPLHETKPVKVDVLRAIDEPTQPQTQNLKRNQGRHAFFRAGAAALLILALVALWIWDALYRPHIDYYANVTKRRGLPEGIGEFSAEQVRHRNLTLEFSKQGRRGPVKEIRAVNSRGAYPPEFAYFPPLSLSELNPLSSKAAEILNICRVTFEYDKGRIVKQSAYDRSDRLFYALHYPKPDIAELKWEEFSQVVSESGITHIRIIRPETGPEAGLDKDVLFLDGTGTPRPHDDGYYGYRRVFDKLGLARESIPLGADGQPTPDRVGIAKFVTEHDELGNFTRQFSLWPDGRPVVGRHGGAEAKARYDQYGNITELAVFGADGQLVTSQQVGAAGRTFAYDGQGNVIENTFFGPDRQLVIGPFGFAKQEVIWDKNGGSLETYFGPDRKPVLISGRVVKAKGTWNKRGYLVESAYLDENDRPVRDARGCAQTLMGRDKYGNVADIICLDEGGQRVRDTSGAARIKRTFDQRGNTLEETYFGPNDQPERYEDNYVKTRWKYNPQGKATEMAYLDAVDKPVRNRDGYAKVTYVYDLQGSLRELAFFDEHGQPTVHKGGYAKIVRAYDPRQNLLEETLLDTGGKPVRSEDGYAKTRFGYDARRYRIETSYYDESDHPATDKEGCVKVRIKYSDKGQGIERACLGLDGASIVSRKHGYAKARRIFDAGGKLARVDFFDANDAQARSAEGYATIRYFYDKFGRETKREFFEVNGEPVFTRVTIDKVEPDSKSQRAGLRAGDVIIAYDGQEVADHRRFNELELVVGERPRQLTIERARKIFTLDVSAGRLTGIETVDKVSAARERSSEINQEKPG